MSLTYTTNPESLADNWRLAVNEAGSADGPQWLQSLRSSAAASFLQYGLPGNKDEAWKYTSLRHLEKLKPQLGQGDAVAADLKQDSILIGTSGPGFRLAGGEFTPLAQTHPDGLSLLTLKEAFNESGPEISKELRSLLESLSLKGRGLAFEALNTALLKDGLVIRVAAGVDAGSCNIIWHQGDAGLAQFRNFRVIVILENDAKLRLCEQFQGERDGLGNGQALNIVSQFQLGERSELKHIRIQNETGKNILFTSTEAGLAADSFYRYHGFDVGGALVRHRMACQLAGQGARTELNGAFVLDGQQHVDNHICVDHAVPGCSSEQFFRGVMGGHSRGVFNGKAIIRAGADGSKVRQSNANLLLSDTAEIDTKPELEIYADEVEASHGATVGQLDELAVFYLRSRGLDERDARKLLTSAFCRTVTDRLSDSKLVEKLAGLLDQAMPAFTHGQVGGE